jgi:hypothetical protein
MFYQCRSRRPTKFEERALRAYVLIHPVAYLSEIASIFKGSTSGIWRAFKRFTITRKESPFSNQSVKSISDKPL